MPLVPASRPAITSKKAFELLDKVFESDKAINRDAVIANGVVSLALRGYYRKSMGPTDGNDVGMFDDGVVVLNTRDNTITTFNWNTDPSRLGYNVAIHKDFAILAEGFWIFAKGQHKMSGPAWRQQEVKEARAGNLGRFYVDNDRRANGNFLVHRGRFDGPTEWGYFAINQHWGAASTSSWGCQTAPGNPAAGQWREYQRLTYKLSSRFLPYALILNNGIV